MKTEKSENEERNDERNEEEKKRERDREEKRKVKGKETNAKEKRESDPLISNSFRKLQLPANRKRSVSR